MKTLPNFPEGAVVAVYGSVREAVFDPPGTDMTMETSAVCTDPGAIWTWLFADLKRRRRSRSRDRVFAYLVALRLAGVEPW